MHRPTALPHALHTVCLAAMMLLLLTGRLAWAQAAAVGTVTLKLGEAWLVAADGSRRPATGPVHAGDTLETAASGHVHVRFADGGLIAVRPASRLVIADYADPAAGGAVRFRLERGQMRAITGGYGEADRKRFRLNTPIAAIGIAGTDFVTQTDAQLTRVAVLQGGIVAAPLGADCRADDLGPCAGPGARDLTAAMGELMLEIRAGEATPLLVPRNGLAAAQQAERAVAAMQEAVDESITQVQAQARLTPDTLVWGRWAHAPAWEGDTLSRPREEVAAGREQVAENDRYVLYRLPQAEPLSNAGIATLGLAAAQAHLVQSTGVAPAQVRDGRLTLDFTARHFSTTLSLDSVPTGPVPFTAAGPIRPDGTFSLIEWQNRLWGAYGTGGGGPSAGYVFERATPQGMFTGITLWR